MKKHLVILILGILVALICIGIVAKGEVRDYQEEKERILLNIEAYWNDVEKRQRGELTDFDVLEDQADTILEQMNQMTTVWMLSTNEAQSRGINSSVTQFMDLHYGVVEVCFFEKYSDDAKLETSYVQLKNSIEVWPSLNIFDSLSIIFSKEKKGKSLEKGCKNIEIEYQEFEMLVRRCLDSEAASFRAFDITRRALQREILLTMTALEETNSKQTDAIETCAALYDEVERLWTTIKHCYYFDDKSDAAVEELQAMQKHIGEIMERLMAFANN